MECTHCGRNNPGHVRYCLDCGTVLRAAAVERPATRLCSSCGIDNPSDSSFCRDCGSKLGQPENATTTVVSSESPTAFEAPAPPGLAASQAAVARAARAPSSRPAQHTVAEARALAVEVQRPDELISRAAESPRAYPRKTVSTRPAAELTPASSGPAPLPAPDVAAAPSPARACKNCGASHGAQARFCQICGRPLERSSGERPRSHPPIPAPQASLQAEFVIIAQDGSPGRRYPLPGPSTLIGSSESAPISLRKDPYVSPEHARVVQARGEFVVEDLHSTNGVFVRIGGPVPLRNGDLLLLGLEVLKFELVVEAERNPSPALRGGTRVFGTPSAPRYARLTVLTVEDKPRDVYHLSRAETVLGRELGDIVFTEDPFMSRRHASIRRDPNTNQFTLRDLGSSNGTFVAIHGSHPLSHGDHVRIGQHLFRLDVRRGG